MHFEAHRSQTPDGATLENTSEESWNDSSPGGVDAADDYGQTRVKIEAIDLFTHNGGEYPLGMELLTAGPLPDFTNPIVAATSFVAQARVARQINRRYRQRAPSGPSLKFFLNLSRSLLLDAQRLDRVIDSVRDMWSQLVGEIDESVTANDVPRLEHVLHDYQMISWALDDCRGRCSDPVLEACIGGDVDYLKLAWRDFQAAFDRRRKHAKNLHDRMFAGKNVIAEGVQTDEQGIALRRWCEGKRQNLYVQGYAVLPCFEGWSEVLVHAGPGHPPSAFRLKP